MAVPDLILDEPVGVPELGQMRHVAVTQTVRRQLRRQPRVVTHLGEAIGDPPRRHPRRALGHEHRGRVLRAQCRSHLGQILLNDVDRPVEHRQHRPATRRPTGHRLAIANMQRGELTELRQRGVRAKVAGSEGDRR